MHKPIFVDANISPAYFKTAPRNTLLVRSMFYTIQGEGPFAGCPAVFVRLGGCNLGAKDVGAAGCAFCDTDFRTDKSVVMAFDEIWQKAVFLMGGAQDLRISRSFQPMYVITGGEPLLQPNVARFVEATSWIVQVETNGMYHLDIPNKAILVMSPKAVKGRYPSPKASMLDQAHCLKFLLEDDPDSPYHAVPHYGFKYNKPVYVSPMAVYKRPMTEQEGETVSAWPDDGPIDRERTARNYNYAAQYAARHGFLLSIQQHLFASMP